MTEEEAQGYADWVDEIRAEVSGQKAAITSASTDNAEPQQNETMNRDEAYSILRNYLMEKKGYPFANAEAVLDHNTDVVRDRLMEEKDSLSKLQSALAALTGQNDEAQLDSQKAPERCPFCGAQAWKVEWEPCEPIDESDTNRLWYVECRECLARSGGQRTERDAANMLPGKAGAE